MVLPGVRRAGAVMAVCLLAACGSEPAPAPIPTSAFLSRSATLSAPVSPGPAASSAPNTPRAPNLSSGWTTTMYYTVVERFHSGEPTDVTGCPRLDCTHGDDHLGTFPAGFVEAVEEEGTGITTDGRYLNWSYDTGYWLDSAARDSAGKPLRAYVSAAADPSVLAAGTAFTVAACGRQDDGSAPPPSACERFRAARWMIADEFTPGLGGRKHIDLYVGPETGPGFTESELYLTLTGVTLRLP